MSCQKNKQTHLQRKLEAQTASGISLKTDSKTHSMLKVGEVLRPYQSLSTHVAKQATAPAHIKAHVADAVAAPRPSANEDPRLKRSHAQLSSIGMKMTPTNGQPVPNTQSMATKICCRNRRVVRKASAPHPPTKGHRETRRRIQADLKGLEGRTRQ